MIDFRYHIVSIAAVFLALGIGVATGATVLDRVTVEALQGRLDAISGRLNESRATITDLRAEREFSSGLVRSLAARVTAGTLEGSRVVFVRFGEHEPWHDGAREAITASGAQDLGSLVLTEKWLLRTAGERNELAEVFEGTPLDHEDPAGHAARMLGEELARGTAGTLLTELARHEFVNLSPAQPGAFATPPVQMVAFSSSDEGPIVSLVLGSAEVAPTLAASPNLERPGALEGLRGDEGPSSFLSTFDSAANDPAGVGLVLAFRSAIDGEGGHFGRADGVPYVPSVQ